MKSFYITTLGCKVNQYESDGISTVLMKHGWTRSGAVEGASICIINTCAVTNRAAVQSRQAVRSIIRTNPRATVIVTGCHAQTEPELVGRIENVHHVVGHGDKFKIADAILEAAKGAPSLPSPDKPFCSSTEFQGFEPSVTGSMTRAYLKIQDGCNAFCSYCIVPYARGRSRSMAMEDVLAHLSHLHEKGYKEVILTGIHTGAWGADLSERRSFYDLLKTIVETSPIHRIRVSSVEPKELSDEIIELTAAHPKICDHFHIPLQSGDDGILGRMGRPYDTGYFRDLVLKIHETMPRAAIGVDLLQGFPGESAGAFERTHDLIADLPITYLHVFPFSPRRGTPAFDFPDRVKPGILKERCAAMRALGRKKRRTFEESNVGKSLSAVVQERRDGRTGMLKAVTDNYLTLLFNGGDDLKRNVVDLTVDSVVEGQIRGHLT